MVEEKRECDTSIENLLDRHLPLLPKRHYQDDRGCTHVLGSNLFARQTASLDTCWSKKEMSVRVEREHIIDDIANLWKQGKPVAMTMTKKRREVLTVSFHVSWLSS